MVESASAEQLRPRPASEAEQDASRRAQCETFEPRTIELDGERFLLRAIRPDDAAAYSTFIARIDEADLRLRFARPLNGWSERSIARYTNLDFDRDVAFVAVRLSEPGRGEIVGEVRTFGYPDAATAEFAIIVRSDMKRRGLGRSLMEHVIRHATVNGLELIGQIATHNVAMIRLAERSGMEVEREAGSDFAVAHLPRNR
jgi:acetyltransferase